MDKESAKTAMALLQEMSDTLNKLTIFSMGLPDKEEQVSIRRHLGPAILENIDLMRYITKQYPDLDPYKEN